MAQDVQDILVDRIPPQNLDAESSVLGSMVMFQDCVGLAVQDVAAEEFYKPANRLIFDAIVNLYDRNDAIDVLTVKDELSRRGILEEVGGAEYLCELAEAVPSAANVEYYANIVRGKYIQRELIGAASGIIKDAFEGGALTDEILDSAQQAVFDVAERHDATRGISIRDVYREFEKRLENIRNRKGRITGVSTGYYELDDVLGGLHPGELSILAARPGIGKTSFMLNLLNHMGVRDKIPVAFFSLEMTRQQLIQNLVCIRCHVNTRAFRSGFLTTAQEDSIRTHGAAFTDENVVVLLDDSPSLTVTQLRGKARRFFAEHGRGIIMVDYLQLVAPPKKIDSREQQIAYISRSLKALAKELDVPVLTAAQLNRGVEEGQKGAQRMPMLSDLRESGSIEQDADVVMFLHRDYYAPVADGGEHSGAHEPVDMDETKIVVAKQRNGPQGTARVGFFKPYLRFSNLEERFKED